MRRYIIKWLLKGLSGKDKVLIAEIALNHVLDSKKDSISNSMAERLITTIIKSSGNKIVSFIIKD